MREPVDWPTRDPLTHRARTTPDATAVIDADADDAWTARAFDRRVDHTAAALDLAAGDRVGLLLDTRPEFGSVVFAAMRRAATAVPLNVRETAAELESKVERTDLDALVCEADTERRATEIADCPVLSVDEPREAVDDSRDEDVRSLYRSGSTGTVEPLPLTRATDAVIAFTSGTSGRPKAVRLTVGNLVASATTSAFRLGVLPDDRWLCCLPMYHVGGFAPLLRSTLYGTTVVLQREFDPDATARVLEDREITCVSLVPTMLSRLLDAGWRPSDSLRFVLLGGAPASSDLIDRCESRDVPVYPTYGMTETASQIATATPAEAFAHEGTVGRPLVCTDVTVLEDGEPVDPGETGELAVSGTTVTPGYLDEDVTAAAFGEYGLHTGDIGYRDADGRLWVCNRRSDRIVTGGENVAPGEVVAVLESYPDVDAAAVVGLADEEWGERVAALVVPAGDEPPSTDALLDHCDGRLAGYKRPKTIGFATELPRTASGTVDREAVRDRLRSDGFDVGE